MPSDAFKKSCESKITFEADSKLYEFVVLTLSRRQQVMPDDHSKVVPLLPIPNRTVKRFSADDSAGSRVKVGHRQAITARKAQQKCWAFLLCKRPVERLGVLLCAGKLCDY